MMVTIFINAKIYIYKSILIIKYQLMMAKSTHNKTDLEKKKLYDDYSSENTNRNYFH